jgi:hypothetical protein
MPLSKIIMLNLKTEEKTLVATTGTPDIYQYFVAMSDLNYSAAIYGVVYLATEEALALLYKRK